MTDLERLIQVEIRSAGGAYVKYVDSFTPFTDEEIQDFLDLVPDVIMFLNACGPRFFIAANELANKRDIFQGFADEREKEKLLDK